MPDRLDHETRAWLVRVALSLAFALVAGALAFLLARGAFAVALFVRHQLLLREVAGGLRGGVEGLAGGGLRAARLLMQQIDARDERLSLLIACAAAAVAVVAGYLWLERRSRAPVKS
ncbi:MAG: hypothetical protein IPO81_07960 [Kouleothrix sp.]|nr:hypothetical protein [Kouleothrix sp.]